MDRRSSRLRRDLFDLALAVALLMLFWSPQGFDPSRTVQSVLLIGPLAVRRRFPVASALTVLGGSLAFGLVSVAGGGDGYQDADIAVPVALYTLAAHGTRRWVVPGLTTALAKAALSALPGAAPQSFTISGELPAPVIAVADTVLLVLAVLLAWQLGLLVGRHRRLAGQLAEQVRELEDRRAQAAELATARERNRISQELHDVVSHSLVVVMAQADGGRYAQDELTARRALEVIAATSRSALADLRRALGALGPRRQPAAGTDPTTTASPAGVDDLESLVRRVRESGRTVSFETAGQPVPLEAVGGHVVYRIVQEALTNVLKHAPATAAVQVALNWSDDQLTVQVVNDAGGRVAPYPDQAKPETPPAGMARGLVGIVERAALVGGTVQTGPTPVGGFAVRARLPVAPP